MSSEQTLTTESKFYPALLHIEKTLADHLHNTYDTETYIYIPELKIRIFSLNKRLLRFVITNNIDNIPKDAKNISISKEFVDDLLSYESAKLRLQNSVKNIDSIFNY